MTYVPEPLPLALQPELREYLFRELMRISSETDVLQQEIEIVNADAETARDMNLITNGDMAISQENGNTASGTSGYYAADEWQSQLSTSVGVVSFARVAAASPNGSINRLRTTVTTIDASLAAGEYMAYATRIEGERITDLLWGTANAKPLIVRFGFKGPAGTYAVSLRNGAANRNHIKTFTITAAQANTDTVQTFIFPGDTSGTWTKDNTIGMYFTVALAAGSTFSGAVDVWQAGNLFGATGMTNGLGALATYELFDVGAYIDSDNTGAVPEWKNPQPDVELLRCQRHYHKYSGRIVLAGWAGAAAETLIYSLALPTTMRATPTVSLTVTSNTNTAGMTVQAAGTSSIEIRAVATAIGNVSTTGDPVIADARM